MYKKMHGKMTGF